MTVKNLSYVKMNNVNPLHLIIDKMNGYIEETNGNKYFTLVGSDESKNTLGKYKELWNKIKELIRSITNNLDTYDEKYMKIKFNSDDDSCFKKTQLKATNFTHQFSKMNICIRDKCYILMIN